MKQGPVTETIEVVTNDPVHERVVLTLRAVVRRAFLPGAEQDVCK
jgi:hypothetical protein